MIPIIDLFFGKFGSFGKCPLRRGTSFISMAVAHLYQTATYFTFTCQLEGKLDFFDKEMTVINVHANKIFTSSRN